MSTHTSDDTSSNKITVNKPTDRPDSLTINVDQTTLDKIRDSMEDKYNTFWGDVIDDEQKRTIEIADKLSPNQPYKINGKDYEYRHVGMKRYRELSKLKSKADSEKDLEKQMDLLTDYYLQMLMEFFGLTQDEADQVPPGEARMAADAAVYKVLHPVPLHPERLKSGSISGLR